MSRNGSIIRLNMDLDIYCQMDQLEFISMTQQKSSSIKMESKNLYLFRNFEYIEKKPGERIDTICSYQMSDYPQER